MSEKTRSYCFTDFECDIEWYKNLKSVAYCMAGWEICPKSKKKHLQGWIQFENPRSWKSIQKIFNPRHIEVKNGSIEQNEKYCRKEGNLAFETGTLPEQGKRNDLIELKEMVKNGTDVKRIFETQPGNYIRYHRGIEKAIQMYHEKRNWKMNVKIYWGPSGSGKTRKVFDEYGIDNIYTKMVGKWWDHYNGEDVVLIDDFDPDNCFDITFDFYLKLLDRYPMKVEYKGGSCEFRSKTIIITSNYDPAKWFEFKSNRAAFFRRVDTIVHINGTEVTG